MSRNCEYNYTTDFEINWVLLENIKTSFKWLSLGSTEVYYRERLRHRSELEATQHFCLNTITYKFIHYSKAQMMSHNYLLHPTCKIIPWPRVPWTCTDSLAMSKYAMVENSKSISWNAAEELCKFHGGHLPSINSYEELSIILSTIMYYIEYIVEEEFPIVYIGLKFQQVSPSYHFSY